MINVASQPVVLLDEETHIYTVDGVPKRSLSSILKPLQPEIPEAAFAMVENARFRGRQIHEACAMILQGQSFDPADLADESLPFVQAFVTFMQEMKPRPLHVETPLYCEHLDFCCTPDWHTKYEVFDLKTTAKPSRVWGLQTAAQALALRGSAGAERMIVWLRPKLKGQKFEVHHDFAGTPRIFSPWDYQVIEDACRGDYDSKAIALWKMG